MKRRLFIQRGTQVIAAEALASGVARTDSTSPPITISRTSRLFTPAESGGQSFVQDVIFTNTNFYCLYHNVKQRTSRITVSTVAGDVLQRFDLPKGAYTRLGIRSRNILIHAVHYFETPTLATPNCILEIEGQSIRVRESLTNGFEGGIVFAGDAKMLLLNPGLAELWTIGESTIVKNAITNANSNVSAAQVHIDVLPNSTICIIRKDGSTIGSIGNDSSYVERPIVSSQVFSAAAHYQAKASSTGATPIVIPATGTDDSGHIFGLVLPSPRTAVNGIEFDLSGNGSAWHQFQFPPRGESASPAPVKLVAVESQLGIVFADGSVAWYTL